MASSGGQNLQGGVFRINQDNIIEHGLTPTKSRTNELTDNVTACNNTIYSCNHCDIKFDSEGSLKVHLQYQHQGENYLGEHQNSFVHNNPSIRTSSSVFEEFLKKRRISEDISERTNPTQNRYDPLMPQLIQINSPFTSAAATLKTSAELVPSAHSKNTALLGNVSGLSPDSLTFKTEVPENSFYLHETSISLPTNISPSRDSLSEQSSIGGSDTTTATLLSLDATCINVQAPPMQMNQPLHNQPQQPFNLQLSVPITSPSALSISSSVSSSLYQDENIGISSQRLKANLSPNYYKPLPSIGSVQSNAPSIGSDIATISPPNDIGSNMISYDTLPSPMTSGHNPHHHQQPGSVSIQGLNTSVGMHSGNPTDVGGRALAPPSSTLTSHQAQQHQINVSLLQHQQQQSQQQPVQYPTVLQQHQPPQHLPLQSFISIKQQHQRLSCDDFSGIMTNDLVDTGGESSSAEEIWDLDSNTVKRYTTPLDNMSPLVPDLQSDPSSMQYPPQQQTLVPSHLSPNTAADHSTNFPPQWSSGTGGPSNMPTYSPGFPNSNPPTTGNNMPPGSGEIMDQWFQGKRGAPGSVGSVGSGDGSVTGMDVKRLKTYQCEACDKWFTSSGHLKRHFNTTLHKNASRQKGSPLGRPPGTFKSSQPGDDFSASSTPEMSTASSPFDTTAVGMGTSVLSTASNMVPQSSDNSSALLSNNTPNGVLPGMSQQQQNSITTSNSFNTTSTSSALNLQNGGENNNNNNTGSSSNSLHHHLSSIQNNASEFQQNSSSSPSCNVTSPSMLSISSNTIHTSTNQVPSSPKTTILASLPTSLAPSINTSAIQTSMILSVSSDSVHPPPSTLSNPSLTNTNTGYFPSGNNSQQQISLHPSGPTSNHRASPMSNNSASPAKAMTPISPMGSHMNSGGSPMRIGIMPSPLMSDAMIGGSPPIGEDHLHALSGIVKSGTNKMQGGPPDCLYGANVISQPQANTLIRGSPSPMMRGMPICSSASSTAASSIASYHQMYSPDTARASLQQAPTGPHHTNTMYHPSNNISSSHNTNSFVSADPLFSSHTLQYTSNNYPTYGSLGSSASVTSAPGGIDYTHTNGGHHPHHGGMFHMNHNLYPSRINSGGNYHSSESTYIPSGLLGPGGDELGCDDLVNGPSSLTIALPPNDVMGPGLTQLSQPPPPAPSSARRRGGGRATSGGAGANNVDGEFRCNECDKIFTRLCYLKQHNKTFHNGEKPYKCGQCGKRFPVEVLYQEHLAKHAGDKPYKCEVCPKQFNHKTDLRRHMCLHTGEKPFSCEVCGKGFIREDRMVKHADTHKKKPPPIIMN